MIVSIPHEPMDGTSTADSHRNVLELKAISSMGVVSHHERSVNSPKDGAQNAAKTSQLPQAQTPSSNRLIVLLESRTESSDERKDGDTTSSESVSFGEMTSSGSMPQIRKASVLDNFLDLQETDLSLCNQLVSSSSRDSNLTESSSFGSIGNACSRRSLVHSAEINFMSEATNLTLAESVTAGMNGCVGNPELFQLREIFLSSLQLFL